MAKTRGRPWYKGIDGTWASAAVLLLGFVLRLWYALQADPFVDEPTTLLVARAIAASGLPTLPSGLFYGNDLPFSYLAGGAVALAGSHPTAEAHLLAVRLVSVTAGVLTIGLVFAIGRRSFSPSAGFFAALLLALSPEAVLWGGRARAYAVLGLVVTVAATLFYAGLSPGRARGALLRRLGLVLLVVATFIHPEAALLLPAMAVGAVLVNGWRWWSGPAHLAELLLAGVGVAARYGLQIALARGWIGGFATLVGSRPPLSWPEDWLLRLESVRPFFFDPERLAWTLLALLALVAAARSLATGRRVLAGQRVLAGRGIDAGRGVPAERGAGRDRATLYFSACLWLVPVGMLLALGSTYQSPRYLVMLLPIFALLAGDGLTRGVDLLASWKPLVGKRGIVAGLVALVLLLGYLPPAVAAANHQEKGFRPALEYVADHWQTGDRVATVAPAACEVVVGHCDLFALGLDYEEFVFRAGDGGLVDRWLGSPWLGSAAELQEALAQALDQGRGLWLVVDEARFRRRFGADFAQAVWQGMELVANTGGVMVFRSYHAAELAAAQPLDAVFGDQVALVGYALGRATGPGASGPGAPTWGEVQARPGQSLPLTLYWQALVPPAGDYHAFVHLLAADGRRLAQADGPPLGGLQPTSRWLPGETLPDRWTLELPADMAPGLYRLEVGLYGVAEDGERLPVSSSRGVLPGDALIVDYVRVLADDEQPPAPAERREVLLRGEGDEIRLLGYALPSPAVGTGGSLDLTLYWQAVTQPAADYTVLLHLLDAAGEIWGQGDGPPLAGFYPTSFWDPGEVVVDQHTVAVRTDAPPGTYRLATGLYQLSTGRRLVAEEGELIVLAEVEVGP